MGGMPQGKSRPAFIQFRYWLLRPFGRGFLVANPVRLGRLMSESPHYSYRLNVLTSETTIWLGADGFQVLEKDRPPRTYSYDQVSKVRISYEPSRAVTDLFICRIYVHGRSAPVATVSSTFYRGFLNFDPQLAAYRKFVEDLHDKLRGRTGVSYRAGVGNLTYWGNALFLTVVFAFSAMLLIPIWEDIVLKGTNIFRLELIIFLAPLAALWFWSNRPRDYDPQTIPQDLLPKADAS